MTISLALHGIGLGVGLALGLTSSAAPPPLAAISICAIPACADAPLEELRLPSEEVCLPFLPPDIELPQEAPLEPSYLPADEILECPEEDQALEPLDLPTVPLAAVRVRRPARAPAPPPILPAPPLPTIAPQPAPRRPPLRVARRPVARRPAPAAPRRASALQLRYAPSPDRYYPLSARRLGLSGSAVIELVVGSAGQVTDVRLIRSSGHASLDGAALSLGRAYRFAPIDGRRRVRLPVAFQLRGSSTRRG